MKFFGSESFPFFAISWYRGKGQWMFWPWRPVICRNLGGKKLDCPWKA